MLLFRKWILSWWKRNWRRYWCLQLWWSSNPKQSVGRVSRTVIKILETMYFILWWGLFRLVINFKILNRHLNFPKLFHIETSIYKERASIGRDKTLLIAINIFSNLQATAWVHFGTEITHSNLFLLLWYFTYYYLLMMVI